MLRRLAGFWRRPGKAERRFVFIVTYGRSGSTVLQNILAGIPSSHMTGENLDVLGGMFRSWLSAEQAKREQGRSPRKAPGDPWRGVHLIDPQRFNRRQAEIFIDEILQPPPGARLIGFKEVRYFDYGEELPAYLDYIRMTFAPALLIFNRRRGADVAKSGWWREDPGDIAAGVAAFDAVTGAYAKAHPDETIILDYDIWKRDLEALRPLFERLGADFDAAAVQQILDVKLKH